MPTVGFTEKAACGGVLHIGVAVEKDLKRERGGTVRSYRLRLNDFGRYGYHKQCESVTLAPEVSVNTKKWIRFEEFRELPPTLQALYLKTVSERFCVGAQYYAVAWGVSAQTVKRYFDESGIALPAGTKKADKQRFAEFVKGEDL